MTASLPVWLIGFGAIALLLLVLVRASATTVRLTLPTACLLAVTLSGVSAAFASMPIGPATIALGLGLVAVTVGLRRGYVRSVHSPVLPTAAVVMTTWVLTITQAVDVDASTALLLARGRDMVLFVVVLLLLVAVPRLHPVVTTAALLVAALAGLTLVQEFLFNNSTDFGGFARVPIPEDLGAVTARHAGPLADVNFWGRLLILAFPLALALGTGPGRRSRPWLVVAAVMVAGMYLTGSRGTLIALAATVFVWLLLTRPGPRTMLALAVGAAAALAVPGVFTRLATLAALGDDSATVAVSDPSLTNRLAVQVVGLAMAEDHPILGVGVANFLRREPEYQRRTGEFIGEGLLAPHNLYLELLAETGVVGLGAWLLFLGTGAFVAARALMTARRLGPAPEAELSVRLSAAVLAALVGWSVASIFLHLSDLSALLAIVALGAALDVRTRRQLAANELVTEAQPDPARSRPPGMAVLVLAIAELMLAVQAMLLDTAAPRWSVTTVATVEPDQPGAVNRAYAYDVQSRDRTLPTYAALLRSPGFASAASSDAGIGAVSLRGMEVSAAVRPRAAVIDVTVTSTDPAAARRLASAVVTTVADWVEATDPLYRLKPEGRPATLREDSPPLGGPLSFAVAANLCGALAVIGWRRNVRRRRQVTDRSVA